VYCFAPAKILIGIGAYITLNLLLVLAKILPLGAVIWGRF
jgi:hypothetical protein